MKNTFIYALCEPGTRTVRYIGKADAPEKRLQRHLRYNSIKTETHLGRWLRSLVSKGKIPALIVLAEVPRDSWQEEEIRYIRSARILGLNLTNGTDGGEGGLNPTPETVRHMHESHLGHVHTPEHNKKISDSLTAYYELHDSPNKGRKASEETKAKKSVAMSGENNPMFGRPGPNKGVPRSPETRAAISKAHIGVPWSEAQRKANESYWASLEVGNRQEGEKNPFFGAKHSAETKAVIKAKRALQKNVKGPSVWSAARRAAFESKKQRDQEIEWALAPYTLTD